MNRREVAVAELEGRIGHVFHDRELLERALTHASVGDGAHKVRHYERLEFLGDRVLNLLAAERLMALNSEAREGEMSRLMAGLVNYHACARVARRIGLPSALRMAHSASKIGARDKDTVLGDACEALIGAIYIDDGLEAAAAASGLWLFDYHLGDGGTGVRVWERLSRACGRRPTIILSADTTADTRQAVRDAGLKLLAKPFKPLALRWAINHLLASPKADGQAEPP